MKDSKANAAKEDLVSMLRVKLNVKVIASDTRVCTDARINTPFGSVDALALKESLFQIQPARRTYFMDSGKPVIIPGTVTRIVNFTRQAVTTVDVGGYTTVSYPVVNKHVGTDLPNYIHRNEGFPTQDIGDISDFFRKVGLDIRNKILVARSICITGNTNQDIYDVFDSVYANATTARKTDGIIIQRGTDLQGTELLYTDFFIFSLIDGNELERDKSLYDRMTLLQFSTESVQNASAHLLDPRRDIQDLSWLNEDFEPGDEVMLSYFYLVGKDGVEPTHLFFRDGVGAVVKIPVKRYRSGDVKSVSGLYSRTTTKRFGNAKALVQDRKIDIGEAKEKLGFYRTHEEALGLTPVEIKEKLNASAMTVNKSIVELLNSIGKGIADTVSAIVKDAQMCVDLIKEHKKEIKTLTDEFEFVRKQAKAAADHIARKHEEEIAKERRKQEDLQRKLEDEKRRYDELKRDKSHAVDTFRLLSTVIAGLITFAGVIAPFFKDKKTKKATPM